MQMRKTLIWIMMIVFIIGTVSAAEVTDVLLGFSKDGNIQLKDINVLPGKLNPRSIESGEYKITVLNSNEETIYETYYTPSFEVYPTVIDPETGEEVSTVLEQEDTSEYFIFDYSLNPSKITVSKDGESVFEAEIGSLICNQDSACNNYENSVSCPADCPLEEGDGFCSSESGDGLCDPDCSNDEDCQKVTPPKMPENEEPEESNKTQTIILIGLAALLWIGLIYLLYVVYFKKK